MHVHLSGYTMVTVTETAKSRLIELMAKESLNHVEHFVRVGVKGGGCSGLSYELKFDQSRHENDQMFEDNGIRIVVEKKSMLYLAGTCLEFSDGLNGKGFVFNNPNATRTCGCGESFSV